MTGRARFGALAMLAFIAACGGGATPSLPPVGQVVLHIDTDAPVPRGDGSRPGPLDPAPLFDRLRVDGILSDGSACDCSREFDVTDIAFKSLSVSVGIVPPKGGGALVRVRLYRSKGTLTGEPNPDATIDVTAALPSIGAERIVHRALLLSTNDAGVPIGQGQPLDLAPFTSAPSLVGSWPGAQRVDCPLSPPDGEVCVPGGAYWMGNPLAAHDSQDNGNRQRIVIVSPFFIDATPVTVAAFRRSGLVPNFGWSGQNTGAAMDYCTYFGTPGPNDTDPINCIAWFEARPYCQKLGKDLPTEAQFEYVASGLEGRAFVWGNDLPSCDDAVFSRAGAQGSYFQPYPGDCRTTRWGGVLPVKSGLRDRLDLPTGTVFDLAGNVNQLTLDRWALLGDPCWSRPGVYTDPVCGPIPPCDPSAPPVDVVERGASWLEAPFRSVAAHRNSIACNAAAPEQGFRCARALH